MASVPSPIKMRGFQLLAVALSCLTVLTLFSRIEPTAQASGTIVTLKIRGTGSANGAATSTNFGATITYDSSQSGTTGTFSFNGSVRTHTLSFTAGTTTGSCMNAACSSFVITTLDNSKKNFKLVCKVSATQEVTIVVPTAAALSQGSLPLLGSLPSAPLSGSTFTVTTNGTTTYSGTISSFPP